MLLEIDLPDDVVLKIKALNVLVGMPAKAIGELIAQLVDRVVSAEIMARVSPEGPAAPLPRTLRNPRRQGLSTAVPMKPQAEYPGDASGISEGLGDDAEEDDKSPELFTEALATEARAQADHGSYGYEAPGQGTAHELSENEIYADTTVEDPLHEAVAGPPERDRGGGVKPEAAFASVAGIPAPQDVSTVKPKAAPSRARSKRRADRPLPPKAKVTLFEAEQNSF